MPLARIEDVSPGAVLARPVEDSMGRVLINAGEPLTEQLLAVLRKRGYAEVDIRPVEAPTSVIALGQRSDRREGGSADMMSSDEDIVNLKQSIAERFAAFGPSNTPMTSLRKAVERVLVERMAARKGLKVQR